MVNFPGLTSIIAGEDCASAWGTAVGAALPEDVPELLVEAAVDPVPEPVLGAEAELEPEVDGAAGSSAGADAPQATPSSSAITKAEPSLSVLKYRINEPPHECCVEMAVVPDHWLSFPLNRNSDGGPLANGG